MQECHYDKKSETALLEIRDLEKCRPSPLFFNNGTVKIFKILFFPIEIRIFFFYNSFMKKNIKGILFFIVFSLPLFIRLSNTLSIPLSAQNYRDMGTPFIRNFTIEDYNADFENWGIVRDLRGVMYFANGSGVLEFDGRYWNLIKIANNSDARSIAIDEKGTIYVGASGDFGYLAGDRQGKLSFVSLLDKVNKENREFTDVWSTFTTRTQGTYYITPTKIFHWHNEVINVIPIRMGPMDGAFIDDELFITTEEKGICVLRGDTIIPLPRCEKIYSTKYGSISILPYPDDRLLIVTGAGKFFLYDLKMLRNPLSKSLDLGKNEVPVSILKPFHSEISAYVSRRHNILHRARALSGNRFAFTTITGGIIIMDQEGRLIQVINKARGLIDNCIWDINEDDNHNLWVGTNIGIAYVEIGCPITIFDYSSGLTGYAQTVTRFNGKLFAFTYGGILYLPEYKLKMVNDNHTFVPLESMKGECNDFFQVKNNLLAVVEDDLLQIDSAFNVKKHTAFYSLCFGWTKKFPDIVFMGLTRGQGLGWIRIIEPKTGEKNAIRLVYNGKFKHIDTSINKIVSDANGDLWLSSSFNGIFHLRFNGDNIRKYRVTNYTTAHGLPGNNLNYVHFFNNRLLVATSKGVYEGIPSGPDKNDYRFEIEKTFGQAIPEENRELINIIPDEKGTIWINSRSGIGMLIRKQDGSYHWNCTPFKKIPGGGESIFLDREGIVWATSATGLFRFDSTMPKDCQVPFNALIHKVTKGRDTVIFSGTYFDEHSRVGELFTVSSLKQPQVLIPNIEYKDNSLTFEFSAAFYEHVRENRFKYMLEGFDKDWSDWTSQHKKEYTNLVEGKYRFRVRARNIFDHQSSEAEFAFTVSPPWYRTIPAYIAWIFSIGGVIAGFVKLYQLRKKAEKNLRESEEKFRVLAEKSVVGICILRDNVVKYANPRFHEIFHYMSGQMTGKNLLDWVKEEDRSLVTLNLEIQAVDQLKSEAFEFRGITSHGDVIHLEGRGTQTQYKGKSAFLETVIDVSDRKKVEEELMQSKKLETVGILSGGIAHDFNNLLSIIMGNLSLVKDSIHNPCEIVEKYMKPMEIATVQAADLVKNFMTLAAGGWIDFKKISLIDILKDIGDEAPQIKEIPVTISIPGDLKPLHGDERKLRQVMTNLLVNAYEAETHPMIPGLTPSQTKPAPSVMINAQNINLDKNNPWNLHEGEYVKVSVIDTGKGIPAYHMDKIFDPYFTTKQRGIRKGMGMGLAICNAIVKKHQGHISITSEVDKGTAVDLFLPAWGVHCQETCPGNWETGMMLT